MKKNLNKLATLALTGILMTGMSFGALAAATIGNDGIAKEVENDRKVTIKKWIGIVNHTSSNGIEVGTDVPDVTYTYSVKGTKTQSRIGENYKVEEGVGSPTVSNAVFTDSVLIKEGKAESSFTIDFSNVTFTNAGVYRYTITETDPTCVDITSKEDVKYLDVYVDKDGEITGYVLMDADENLTGEVASDSGKKKEGFNYRVDEDGTVLEGDQYNTYDLLVKKVISGNTSVKEMSFNFDVTLEKGTNGVENVNHNYYKNSESGTKVIGNGYGTIGAIALTDNDTVTIKNVPASAAVKIKETNTTVNAFDVTVENAYFGDLSTNRTATLESGTSAYVETTGEDMGRAAKTVTVTNTYKSTPVTGVVMDIAPYAAMVLGAGAFAGVFLGRKKSEDEE